MQDSARLSEARLIALLDTQVSSPIERLTRKIVQLRVSGSSHSGKVDLGLRFRASGVTCT